VGAAALSLVAAPEAVGGRRRAGWREVRSAQRSTGKRNRHSRCRCGQQGEDQTASSEEEQCDSAGEHGGLPRLLNGTGERNLAGLIAFAPS